MKSVWDNVTKDSTLEDLSDYRFGGHRILEFLKILVTTVPDKPDPFDWIIFCRNNRG